MRPVTRAWQSTSTRSRGGTFHVDQYLVSVNSISLRCRALLLTASLAVVPAGAPAEPLSATRVAKIDAIVRSAMAAQHLAGVEVAVGRNGTTLFTKGYGLRDTARELPVTSRTVFLIGSITKQFTAACVMLLVEQGKVRLDAPVSTYLPDVPHAAGVTVRELLDQTSGLPDYLEDKPLATALLAGTYATNEPPSYYVNLTRRLPPHFKPGTKWMYSNTNYLVLGMLVAKIAGESYPDFLDQAILQPQGLSAIQYPASSIPAGRDVARGYTYANGGFTVIPQYDVSWAGSAGALASDAADLVKWDGAFFGGHVISPANVTIATTPPHGIAMDVPKKSTQGAIARGYAFGWVRGNDEGRTIIWHNGGTIGGRAMNATFADGLEIVVLTNATTADPESVALKISHVLYGE
jgi:D-alanyl-D-alanine carboxypeptidase